MRRPAAAAAVCLAAGTASAAAGLGPVRLPELAVLLIAGLVCRRYYGKKRTIRWGVLCLLLLAGNGYYHIRDSRLATGLVPPSAAGGIQQEEWSVALTGTVDSPVEVDGDRVVLYIRANEWGWEDETVRILTGAERVYTTIRLTDADGQQEAATWKRGDRIQLAGTAKTPEQARNFGGFDFREYLRKQNVHWIVTVKGIDSICIDPPQGFGTVTLLRWTDMIRARAGEQVERLFPGTEAGYMKGLLIGMREDLDPERFRDFSRLGMTHILAISGMHVGVFVWAVTALGRRLGLTRERTVLAAVWAVPFYVAFTGLSPSVVRAGLTAMGGLYAAGKGWLRDALSLLGLALVGMLLWSPHYITDVGFQLSFLVTAGLIAGISSIGRLIPLRSAFLHGSITVSLTAQLVSFPLSIYYFNQFSLLSLPANVVLVPVISFVVTPLGYAALLLAPVWPAAAGVPAFLASRINDLTFLCLELTERLPSANLIWASPSPWWIGAYYGLLCLCIGLLGLGLQMAGMEQKGILLAAQGAGESRRCRRLGLLAGGGLVLLLAVGYAPDRIMERGTGTVAFLDVGQGDSIWVRTPGGKNMLVDGGGTVSFRKAGEEWKERREPFEVGRKTIVPLLKKRGVQKLDYVLVTHEDQDHIGGLPAVLEEIPVGAILFNGTLKSSPGAAKLFNMAIHRGIPLIAVQAGQVWQLDEHTRFIVLSPTGSEDERVMLAENQNDVSVAVMLQLYEHRFLLTGDMGIAQEAQVLEAIQESGDLKLTEAEKIPLMQEPGQLLKNRVDVLKIAHHGSKNSTSSDWLAYWQPKLSVISAGRNNMYGHPHRLTLERLEEAQSAVLRTDLLGEVQFRASGAGLQVRVRLGGDSVDSGKSVK